MNEWSYQHAVESIQPVRSKISKQTYSLCLKNKFFHDAYISNFALAISPTDHRTIDCTIFLAQDIEGHDNSIRIFLKKVECLILQVEPSSFLGAEIYSFYVYDDPAGVKILCSTDEMIRFEITAKKLIVRKS